MAQKYTEKKKESNRRWDAANLDRISVAVPKGNREKIKEHAVKVGESVNAFIIRSVTEQMTRDLQHAADVGESSPGLDYDVILPHIEKTGETVADFVSRSIKTTIESDNRLLKFGMSPTESK